MRKKSAFFLFLIVTAGLFFFVYPYYQEAKVVITYEVKRDEKAQVYWKTKSEAKKKGYGYTEQNSRSKRLSARVNEEDFIIPSLKKIASLRLDPAKRKTDIVIQSLTIYQVGYDPIVFQLKNDWKGIGKANDIRFKAINDNQLYLQATGEDPFFEIQVEGHFHYLRYCKELILDSYHLVSKRADLLGLSWSGFFFLFFDCLILLSISATFFRWFKKGDEGGGETFVAVGLISLGCIILSVILLGMSYQLSNMKLVLMHLMMWLGLHVLKARKKQANILTIAVNDWKLVLSLIFSPLGRVLSLKPRDSLSLLNFVLLCAVIFLLIYSLIPAAFTLPLNFDSNDYRLSRIGYWLQEGNIWQFASNDIRQVIMPANCEFAMIWITSFFPKGYPFVHLISFTAGLLVCGTIFSFMKWMKFQLHWRLIAVIFWLGIANAASEMISSQTDLFTTGYLVSGLLFLYKAIRKNNNFSYFLAGLGIGLAVGGKSTVFLWGPGLLFLFICLLIFYRAEMDLRRFVKGMIILTITLLLSGGFIYAQNQYHFGNILGPKENVSSISDSDQAMVKIKKKDSTRKKRPLSQLGSFILRAKMYTWQVFEPSSTLRILHPFSEPLFNAIEKNIRKKGENVDASFMRRFYTGTSWVRRVKMSEDYASFGLVPFALFLFGGIVAFYKLVRSRDHQSIAASVLFASVLLYMVFFCYVVGWTIHRYRYAVLVTPFMAIISVYFLTVLTSFKRFNRYIFMVVCLIGIYQFSMSVNIAHGSRTHGWRSFKSPSKAHNYVFYWYDLHKLVERLPEKVKSVGLFLSKGSWKALFFRTGRDMKAYYIASDDGVTLNDGFFKKNGYDAVITKSLSSVFIEDSYNMIRSQRDTHHALITIGEGENQIPWVVKRGIWRDGWTRINGRILFGNWQKEVMNIGFCNPTGEIQNITLRSSQQTAKEEIDVNKCIELNLQVKKNDHIEWQVRPGYYPWKQANAIDKRSLGLKITLPDY